MSSTFMSHIWCRGEYEAQTQEKDLRFIKKLKLSKSVQDADIYETKKIEILVLL